MIDIVLLILLVCAVFAYIPLTLVVVHTVQHSRSDKVRDKYHEIKKRYWKVDYYGDSESDIAQLEKEIESAS